MDQNYIVSPIFFRAAKIGVLLTFTLMTLHITAFGIARDILGARVLAFETPEALTVGELKRQLLEGYPAFGNLSSLYIAVNAEYGDAPLREQDDIALIPPVSGGNWTLDIFLATQSLFGSRDFFLRSVFSTL